MKFEMPDINKLVMDEAKRATGGAERDINQVLAARGGMSDAEVASAIDRAARRHGVTLDQETLDDLSKSE